MRKPVINISELNYRHFGKGDRFSAERAAVSSKIGAEKLGYAVIRVPPGKRAWPYHSHREVEEMFFVLEGEGTLRHAGKEFAVQQGDFICSPADADQPHQIVNTSDRPLIYLALSNQPTADVMHYPDSGKFGVWQGESRDPNDARNFLVFAPDDAPVDYWQGEADDNDE